MDLISRRAVLDMANGWTYNFCDPEDEWAAMKEIRELPSAEPERKKGRWKEIEFISDAYDIHGVKTWACRAQCDSCGIIMTWVEGHYSQYHYCPNCGADMRGEEEHE